MIAARLTELTEGNTTQNPMAVGRRSSASATVTEATQPPPEFLFDADLSTPHARAEGPTILPDRVELEKGGWRLVRHCPAGDRWHWASDNLIGTVVYGDPKGGEHPNAPQWSVRFEGAEELLLCTGDGSKWLVLEATELAKAHMSFTTENKKDETESTRPIRVLRSSLNSAPHSIMVFHCYDTPMV